jgi:hypothetical protein
MIVMVMEEGEALGVEVSFYVNPEGCTEWLPITSVMRRYITYIHVCTYWRLIMVGEINLIKECAHGIAKTLAYSTVARPNWEPLS